MTLIITINPYSAILKNIKIIVIINNRIIHRFSLKPSILWLISPTIVRPKVTIGIGKANIETYYFQGLTLWYPTRTPYLQTWQVPHGAACDIDAWTLLTLLAKRTSFEGLTVEVRYLENINMLCLLLISTRYEPTMVCLSD